MKVSRNIIITAAVVAFFGLSLAIGFSIRRADYPEPFDAARLNNASAVRYHLRQGFDPNRVDAAGRTMLDLALGPDAEKTKYHLVESLVLAGIDLKRPSGNSTYLIRAAKIPRLRLIKLLAESGADPNQRDIDGKTPLMHLGQGMGASAAMAAQHLLDAGADPNLVAREGETALSRARILGNRELEKVLLENGATR